MLNIYIRRITEKDRHRYPLAAALLTTLKETSNRRINQYLLGALELFLKDCPIRLTTDYMPPKLILSAMEDALSGTRPFIKEQTASITSEVQKPMSDLKNRKSPVKQTVPKSKAPPTPTDSVENDFAFDDNTIRIFSTMGIL